MNTVPGEALPSIPKPSKKKKASTIQTTAALAPRTANHRQDAGRRTTDNGDPSC